MGGGGGLKNEEKVSHIIWMAPNLHTFFAQFKSLHFKNLDREKKKCVLRLLTVKKILILIGLKGGHTWFQGGGWEGGGGRGD